MLTRRFPAASNATDRSESVRFTFTSEDRVSEEEMAFLLHSSTFSLNLLAKFFKPARCVRADVEEEPLFLDPSLQTSAVIHPGDVPVFDLYQ